MRPRNRSGCRASDRRSIAGVSDMKFDVFVLLRPGFVGAISAPPAGRPGPGPVQPGRPAMTEFTVHSAESAPAASRPQLEGIGRSFGFVPNLFGVFAESPAALRGALAIYEAFST